MIVVDSLLLQAPADVRVHGYFIYFQDGFEHPMRRWIEDLQGPPNPFERHWVTVLFFLLAIVTAIYFR